jgi:hypothetical protein
VGRLLEDVGALDDHTITEAVRIYGGEPGHADELTLTRIERDHEEASQRLAKTRDIGALQATMVRLDLEAEAARQPRQHRRLAPGEVVDYLRSVPALWTDSGADGRRALARALFSSIEVEGDRRMIYELTPDAVALGLDVALPAVLEVGADVEFGRGERDSASLTHLSRRPPLTLVNRTRDALPEPLAARSV